MIFRSHERQERPRISLSNSGQQLSDEDFESAIALLEASTASIEKQCKSLEAQKQALEAIQARNATTMDSDGAKSQRYHRITREKAQLEFATAELVDSMQSQIEISLKQAESATKSIQPSIDRVFEKDDRLLDGLEKALQQVSVPLSGSETSEEVERLCNGLIACSSAEIHHRINTAYRSALQGYAVQSNGANGQDLTNQRDSLRAELDELCREVDGLSTMAVENQYRAPISRALGSAKSDFDTERCTWTEYLSSTLQHLTARLEAMNDGSQSFRSHLSALKTVSKALNGVLSISVDQKESLKAFSRSPTKQSQKGLKPLRLVQANLLESQDPAVQLLRQLDIRLPEPKDAAQLLDNLGPAVLEKSRKLSSFSGNSEQDVSDQATQSLTEVGQDVQSLLSAVFAYSPYATINLVNGECAKGVDRLEQKTQSLGDEMRQLGTDQISRDIRSGQEAFLKNLKA